MWRLRQLRADQEVAPGLLGCGRPIGVNFAQWVRPSPGGCEPWFARLPGSDLPADERAEVSVPIQPPHRLAVSVGFREARHIGKGTEQQAFQRITIACLKQIIQILLDEGPAQAGRLFDPPVDMRRGNAGAVPERSFQVARRKRILKQLWKVEPGIHIEAPVFAGALVIHDKQGALQQPVAGGGGPGKACLPCASAEDRRGFHGARLGWRKGPQPCRAVRGGQLANATRATSAPGGCEPWFARLAHGVGLPGAGPQLRCQRQPAAALRRRAAAHRTEAADLHWAEAAERQDGGADLHNARVAVDPAVIPGRCVQGGDYPCAAAGQQPVPPHRIAPVAEGVPRQQHAVEEALQQGRHRAPPGGIDQPQVIAGFDRIGDVLQIGFQGLDLAVAVAQHRVEFELAQCDQAHPVAGVFGSGGVALGEGAAQAVAVGVAQQDKDGAGHGNLGQWKVREVGLCPWGRVKRRVRRRQGSRWVAGRSRHCRSAATAVVRR
ncbi:hypothetical protein G6F57_012156 [Rhizopus arrhizus]|nr:hypothetical protein G6F57_012156 [Rhizopus arrhizus]